LYRQFAFFFKVNPISIVSRVMVRSGNLQLE
jgi:hypothetical protein